MGIWIPSDIRLKLLFHSPDNSHVFKNREIILDSENKTLQKTQSYYRFVRHKSKSRPSNQSFKQIDRYKPVN